MEHAVFFLGGPVFDLDGGSVNIYAFESCHQTHDLCCTDTIQTETIYKTMVSFGFQNIDPILPTLLVMLLGMGTPDSLNTIGIMPVKCAPLHFTEKDTMAFFGSGPREIG